MAGLYFLSIFNTPLSVNLTKKSVIGNEIGSFNRGDAGIKLAYNSAVISYKSKSQSKKSSHSRPSHYQLTHELRQIRRRMLWLSLLLISPHPQHSMTSKYSKKATTLLSSSVSEEFCKRYRGPFDFTRRYTLVSFFLQLQGDYDVQP